ncbi:hypothetical protein BHE74_00030196 [Ensete ventricosum]|nr:hypothetical protein BHE74_00030196 [Ensete ventricosum]
MIWDCLHAEAICLMNWILPMTFFITQLLPQVIAISKLLYLLQIFLVIFNAEVLLWILADRKLGKFRPKARAKPVKVTSAAPKPSDATLHAPLKPVAPDADSNLEMECPYLQPCASNSYSVACDHHSMHESVGQPKSTLAEPVESEGKYVENFQQNQGNIDQVKVNLLLSCHFFEPLEMAMLSGLESLDEFSSQHNSTTENNEDDDAYKPCRKLRKRIAKCSTDQIEVGSNDERDIDNFNVCQMDGSRSDDCHTDEDMPKPKRTKRKSKKQTNEIEKPTRKRKKAFEKPDSVVENSPKKRFPHATRRRRRQGK